jgi:hypothetical protein
MGNSGPSYGLQRRAPSSTSARARHRRHSYALIELAQIEREWRIRRETFSAARALGRHE